MENNSVAHTQDGTDGHRPDESSPPCRAASFFKAAKEVPIDISEVLIPASGPNRSVKRKCFCRFWRTWHSPDFLAGGWQPDDGLNVKMLILIQKMNSAGFQLLSD
jgi:hypothetical protein